MNTSLMHSQNTELENTIKTHDNTFWEGYNNCDINTFKNYISDDFEFYHDKNGLTKGDDAFIKKIEEGLCNINNHQKLRREVVKGSIKIYPLKNYGAIISGEHVFYLRLSEKKEQLIESAKFTHVWQFIHNKWKMTRVLSYDHKNVMPFEAKKEIILSDEILDTYIGNYKAEKTGLVTISKLDGHLHISAGKMKAIIYAESTSLFFHKEAPLTFEFIKNNKNEIVKMIVREQDNIVEEAIKD